jgi:hypothetical protein
MAEVSERRIREVLVAGEGNLVLLADVEERLEHLLECRSRLHRVFDGLSHDETGDPVALDLLIGRAANGTGAVELRPVPFDGAAGVEKDQVSLDQRLIGAARESCVMPASATELRGGGAEQLSHRRSIRAVLDQPNHHLGAGLSFS